MDCINKHFKSVTSLYMKDHEVYHKVSLISNVYFNRGVITLVNSENVTRTKWVVLFLIDHVDYENDHENPRLTLVFIYEGWGWRVFEIPRVGKKTSRNLHTD